MKQKVMEKSTNEISFLIVFHFSEDFSKTEKISPKQRRFPLQSLRELERNSFSKTHKISNRFQEFKDLFHQNQEFYDLKQQQLEMKIR